MRTTIRLEDALLRKAKARAAESGISLNEFIENAVRLAVAPRAAADKLVPSIPVFKGGQLLPGVDLDDSSSLLDLMDDVQLFSKDVPLPKRVAETPSKKK